MRCVSTHLGLADDELDGPQNSDSSMHPGGAAKSVFFYQPSGIAEEQL
jgi:hypothetical protein